MSWKGTTTRRSQSAGVRELNWRADNGIGVGEVRSQPCAPQYDMPLVLARIMEIRAGLRRTSRSTIARSSKGANRCRSPAFARLHRRHRRAGARVLASLQGNADRIGAERGWPPMNKAEFEQEIQYGSLYLGSPETVAQKIAATVRALASRFDLKYK